MVPPAWPATAPPCFRARPMSEQALRIPLTLPYGWEYSSLGPHALASLWHEGQLVLRVVNQMEVQSLHEGEGDAATARLEAKLDLALHLLAQTVQGDRAYPAAAQITLWSDGCALPADPAWQAGDQIVLSLYLYSPLALPLKMAASVSASIAGQAELRWTDMSEAALEAWEQWLFRQHRRRVQAQRGQR